MLVTVKSVVDHVEPLRSVWTLDGTVTFASDSDPQVVTKAVRAPARRESRCGPRSFFNPIAMSATAVNRRLAELTPSRR